MRAYRLKTDRLQRCDFEEIVLEGEEINRASIEGKAVGLCRDM